MIKVSKFPVKVLLVPKLARFYSEGSPYGVFKYALLDNKAYLRLIGRDSIKFLNGLVTSKLLPYYEKKNLTTIDSSSTSTVTIPDWDYTTGNWGLYNAIENETGVLGEFISRFGTYTSFLNSKGRLMTDSIIYPFPVTSGSLSQLKNKTLPEYLIEVDRSMIEAITKVFSTHKLLSQIRFKKLNHNDTRTWDVMIEFQNLPSAATNPWIQNVLRPLMKNQTPSEALTFANDLIGALFRPEHVDDILAVYIDIRWSAIMERSPNTPLMLRVVTRQRVENIGNCFDSDQFPIPCQKLEVQAGDFRSLRYRFGFLDGIEAETAGTLLPLDLNFDYQTVTLSLQKGCYVGQELTARTHALGTLRKRLIPVHIDDVCKLSSTAKPLTVRLTGAGASHGNYGARRNNQNAGKLVAHEGNQGLAVLRTEYFPSLFTESTEGTSLEFEVQAQDGSTVRIVPQKPYWYERWKSATNSTATS